jgi:cyclase
LISSVCNAVTVPVICCGGAGSAQHFVDVFLHTSVCAAAAANFFHFTEHSVTTIKALINRQIHVRHETHADYDGSRFDVAGRLLKKDDQELENLRFIRIEKEII